MKLASYQREIGPIRTWYQEQHRNWIEIIGQNSKWKVWNTALSETKAIVKKVQIYLDRTAQGTIHYDFCSPGNFGNDL